MYLLDTPPHHLSTHINVRAKCSQAIPIFRRSSFSVSYTEPKPKNNNNNNNKKGLGWEQDYI